MTVTTVTPITNTPLTLGAPPCEGGFCVRVPLIFDGSGDAVIVDLSTLQGSGKFSAAQTLFIDNHTNAAEIDVTCNQSLQTFVVPIGGMIQMNLLLPNPPKISFVCSVAVTIYALFINFFLPPVVWGPTIGGGGGGGGVTALTPTDDSGTIAAGGTPQIAIAANAARLGFIISNPKSETEVLQIAFGNTGNYIDLSPGATYETGAIFWSGDIYVNAATTGHVYTAYEGT